MKTNSVSQRKSVSNVLSQTYVRHSYQFITFLLNMESSSIKMLPSKGDGPGTCATKENDHKKRAYRMRDTVSNPEKAHAPGLCQKLEIRKLCSKHNLKALIKKSIKVVRSRSKSEPLRSKFHRESYKKIPRPRSIAKQEIKTSNKTLSLIPSKFVTENTDQDERAESEIVSKLLSCSGNVESNPGPGEDQPRSQPRQPKPSQLMVKSYNVRGLNDERKLRHLLNCIYKSPGSCTGGDNIICLQETFIENAGKIPYLWRGNYVMTAGNGQSCGCITLLSSHLNVVETRIIGSRAHVAVCQRSNENQPSYIIANLYAPNPNNNEKIEFFNNVFDVVHELSEKYNCTSILVAGDFNTVLSERETKNRNFSAQEKRVADNIKSLMGTTGLVDCWEKKKLFTWRRPNSNIFSTIDRILFSVEGFELESVKSDWTLSFSDHAAAQIGLKIKNKKQPHKSRLTRLDPSLAKSPVYGALIEEGFNEMYSTAPMEWDPHMKLEFAKMCIRTVTERVQADRKRTERTEEDSINEELEAATEKLASGSIEDKDLIDYVEELRNKKAKLIEEKGLRLAERLGTKWFNEGEKSTRYFLRLLNRAQPDSFDRIQRDDGVVITEPDEIESEIVNFYRNLYELEDVVTEADDNFFNEISPVTDQENEATAAPMTADELRRTLDTCSDSAPGPDGIPYSLIRLLWPTYGKILATSWEYSLRKKSLPVSHRTSLLKLIPKAGKDPARLTNWRPITLSNCDHKIITKAYALRLSAQVATKINERQTAYLKGRLINDNIRSLLSIIELGNEENDLNGLIVALDAKKAFDSVSHSYIEKCLKSFGCHSFVNVFKTLYKDLETDILINGKVTKGFKIRRGVKQGDALSCILFIMCMEPLLRNIEVNPNIIGLRSASLGCSIPKNFAYADDVSCVIADTQEALQAVFSEYERLSDMSGLILNAEKTELMRISTNVEKEYWISYRGERHKINSCEKMKLNGILFQRDRKAMSDANVDAVIDRMDKHFKNWSRRSLSTLGRILICKTFGISQLIYLLQTVTLNADHFKKINALMYRFIWNRHYLASKAPERIKREIVTNSIKKGGLGMLDIVELDDGLKLRALGRLLTTDHPYLKMFRENLNLSEFFDPSYYRKVDPVTVRGLELLCRDRELLWANQKMNSDRSFIAEIRELGLKDIVKGRGQGSINFFNLWTRGRRKVKDLNQAELDSLHRHLEIGKIEKLRIAVNTNIGPPDPAFVTTYYTGKCHAPLKKLTSKEIRTSRDKKLNVTEFKVGITLTTKEAATWALRLSKLTSTRHKNTILRVVHGEIYTKEKLSRFGLIDSATCPRCDQVETLRHKFIECHYSRKIWAEALPYIEKLAGVIEPSQDKTKIIIAANINSNLAAMTLSAEIMQVILQLNPDQTFLVHPRHVIKQVIKRLRRNEGNQVIKKDFIELVLS